MKAVECWIPDLDMPLKENELIKKGWSLSISPNGKCIFRPPTNVPHKISTPLPRGKWMPELKQAL